jgi:hypothetical protein
VLIPIAGSLERIFLERIVELDNDGKGRGVTFLDFIGTGITEENIDQVVQNLRNNMFIAENDHDLKADA